MPLTHPQIEALRAVPTDSVELAMLRQATLPWQVTLSPDMAAALGTQTRRLTPFLATVVDVIANKLEVDDRALKLGKVADTKAVKGWLGDESWAAIERELMHAVVRDSRAYVLTSWREGAGLKLSVLGAYDGVCGAHVVCENDEPICGWNTWAEGDSYFDVYYGDRIEKYVKSAGENKEWQPRQDEVDEEWPLPWVDDAGQPLGIALVECCIDRSDICDALQIGRDMNEALLDMLASSRTQGWPQRYMEGPRNADLMTNVLGQPIISSHTGRPIKRQVYLSPGSVMLLSEGSKLGQLDPTRADVTVLDKLLELLSFITTVPTHYFTGQWPSGIALIQAESRLNHKVEGHQGRLSSALAAIVRLALRLSNHFAGTSFNAEQTITIPWHAPQIETEDLRREREQFAQESVVALVEAGLMSREIALRTLHPEWSDDEIQLELARLATDRPPAPPLPPGGSSPEQSAPVVDSGVAL